MGFNELVHFTWESSVSVGSNSQMFWAKLKKTKVAIKEWCKQIGAGDPFRISHLEEEIDKIEKMKQDNQTISPMKSWLKIRHHYGLYTGLKNERGYRSRG